MIGMEYHEAQGAWISIVKPKQFQPFRVIKLPIEDGVYKIPLSYTYGTTTYTILYFHKVFCDREDWPPDSWSSHLCALRFWSEPYLTLEYIYLPFYCVEPV